MSDPRFDKGIRDLRKLSMTASERTRIFKAAVATVSAPSSGRVESPWNSLPFSRWVGRFPAIAIAGLALLVGVGTGLVSASAGALPGDALYTIKVGVVEPVRGAFAQAPVGQAKLHAALAVRRLTEAEILALNGSLDLRREEQVTTLLDKHARAAAAALDEVRNGDEPDAADRADSIAIAFQADLGAHAQILEAIDQERGSHQAFFRDVGVPQADVVGSAQMNAEAITPPRILAIRPSSLKLAAGSAPAPMADVARSTGFAEPAMMLMTAPVVSTEAAGSGSISPAFAKKYDSLATLIDRTADSLAQTDFEGISESLAMSIRSRAESSLAEARSLAHRAADQAHGYEDSAYASLLEAERFAREAATLAETGSSLRTGGR